MTLSIALTKAKLSRLGLILEEDEPYSPPDSTMRERYNHIRKDIHSSNRRDRDRQRSSKRNQEESPDEEHSPCPPCEGEFREEDSGIFELREEEMEENHQSIDEFLTSLDLGFPEFSPRKDVSSGETASGLDLGFPEFSPRKDVSSGETASGLDLGFPEFSPRKDVSSGETASGLDLGFPEFSPRKDVSSGEKASGLDLGFPEFSPRKDVSSGEKASGLRRSPSSCKSLCSLDEDCTRAEVDIKGVRTGRAREKYKKFACLGDTKGKYQHPLSIN